MTSKDELTRVVCVNNDRWLPHHAGRLYFRELSTLPPLNVVLCVTGTHIDVYREKRLLIAGWPNRDGSGTDKGWSHRRFRPAIAAKTEAEDVALVKSLLSIGNEELAADKQRVDELLKSLEAAWAAYPGEG